MERGTKTTAGDLKPGDRFHKAADKAKKVHEVITMAPAGRSNKFFNLQCVPDGGNPRYPVTVKSTVEVVFLRHKL